MNARNFAAIPRMEWAAFLVLLIVVLGQAAPSMATDPASRGTAATTEAGFDAVDAVPSTTVPSGSHDLNDMTLEDLMNVQVTSVSKKAEAIADAPAAVTVIDQDAINRSGFSTIPDLLRLVPGMEVARINSYTWAISARGFNDQYANKLLVLQDGRTLYSPIDGGVFWNSVDYVIQDLDRIEVIRGPGATLWGSNAVNGVINITTKDARDTQGWLVSGRGSNDDSGLSARYGGKIDSDTFYRVYVKGKYDQGFESDPGVSPAINDGADHWYAMRGGFRLDKHPGDADAITLQGDFDDAQIRTPSPVPITQPPFMTRDVFNGSSTSGNMLGRWSHSFSEDSDFAVQMYYDYLAVNQGTAEFSEDAIDLDAHDRFTMGKRNEVTWGAGYRVYFTHNPDMLATSWNPQRQTRNLYNIFLQDKLTILPDHLFLTGGTKLEHNDFTGFELEPSGRLLWTPDKQNSIWASISRATRSPDDIDTELKTTYATFAVPNGSGGTVPGRVEVMGIPNFASEKLVAYELGYRVQLCKAAAVDISGFYNHYTSLQTLVTGNPILGPTVIIPARIENGERGYTTGIEVASNLTVTDRWRLAGSYSLLFTKLEASPGAPNSNYQADDGAAPRNQAQLHSYLDITRQLHLNAGVYFVDRIPEYQIPAYISTDLNVTWEPREDLELMLGVSGLVDNNHPEYGTTANQGYADQVPRTVYAQVTWRF
jgi:iron complex outermembrane receptor protein